MLFNMKSKLMSLASLIALCMALNAQTKSTLFDDGWRFHRGGAQRAEQPAFNDSEWRMVDLPHDWSIEDLPDTQSPFNRNAISQVSGGFTTGGTGWYRKTFFADNNLRGKQISIRFDGVYMNAECWLNGNYLGNHPYGYTSFAYDITNLLQYGKTNVLAVIVRNEGENSRWYSGSGIFRHVWLTIQEPLHFPLWGTKIVTTVSAEGPATVKTNTLVYNKEDRPIQARLVTRIMDNLGNQAGISESKQLVEPGKKSEFTGTVEVSRPMLWSPAHPDLYTIVNEVYNEGQLADREEISFGIRTISVDPTHGFLLNGDPVKLKGGCIHHDNGPLGSKAFDRAEERKVELLKASGYNAIRTSHNPPSPALLDACDRLGMMVIDETFDMWEDAKNPGDYHLYFHDWWKKDVESMVLRDRNHPSVIMWSIGNEIPNRTQPAVVATSKDLADFVRELDPTRPVTAAVNDLRPDKDPFFATLQVAGYNYAAGGDHLQASIYEQDHTRIPERIMSGTESYPLEAFESWMDVLDHPYVIGDFVWTAWDYIGEASIGWRGYWQEQGFFPWNLAFCGDIDVCGWKRPQSFYRDALWKADQVSLFVTPPVPSFENNPNRQSWSKWHWYDVVACWNWSGYENVPLAVSIYSSCERVELFLNGKSLGSKSTDRSTRFMATWDVPYVAGILKVAGYHGKKKVSEAVLQTAGKSDRIRISADRHTISADNQDLCYITVELTDSLGIRNPQAENLVRFELTGPGTIVGVGNGNPVSLESYLLPQRKTWQGRCMVIVRAAKEGGTIRVKATSEGLPAAVVEILSEPVIGKKGNQ